MGKFTITTTGVKAILLVASLFPIFLVVYSALSADLLSIVLTCTFSVTLLLHLYFGYRWAKYTAALLSILFAISQFFIFKFSIGAQGLGWGLLCILLIINAFLLVRSKAVTDFLALQFASRSKSILLVLKSSRLLLILFVAIGLIKDLMLLNK